MTPVVLFVINDVINSSKIDKTSLLILINIMNMNLPDNKAELKCGRSAESTKVVRLIVVHLKNERE